MKTKDIFEKDDGQFYTRTEGGSEALVMAGWYKGCSSCGAFRDQIQDVMDEKGALEACKWALEHLPGNAGAYLCGQCLRNNGC